MSDTGGSFSKVKVAAGFLITVILFLVLYMVGVSGFATLWVKYGADRADPSSLFYQFPRWIIPNKAWHDVAGYPNKYSNVASVIPSYASPIRTITSVRPADCMLECNGEKDNCIGFLYNTTSNTCTLFDDFEGLTPVDSASNVVYVVDGFEPTKQYTKNTAKSMVFTAVPITNIVLDTTTNVATVTTTQAHNFVTGNFIKIDGNTAVAGANVITVKDTTNFTFPLRTTTTSTTAGGTATLLPSSMAPITSSTYLICASACTSNTSCTGFLFGTDSVCTQYDIALDPAKITGTAGDTYIIGPPSLTPSLLNYY